MSLPCLTQKKILSWADAHYLRNREWPQKSSGPIADTTDETWLGIGAALRQGFRGLKGGLSLPVLLHSKRGVRNISKLAKLTESRILAWVDSHHIRTGVWPAVASGIQRTLAASILLCDADEHPVGRNSQASGPPSTCWRNASRVTMPQELGEPERKSQLRRRGRVVMASDTAEDGRESTKIAEGRARKTVPGVPIRCCLAYLMSRRGRRLLAQACPVMLYVRS